MVTTLNNWLKIADTGSNHASKESGQNGLKVQHSMRHHLDPIDLQIQEQNERVQTSPPANPQSTAITPSNVPEAEQSQSGTRPSTRADEKRAKDCERKRRFRAQMKEDKNDEFKGKESMRMRRHAQVVRAVRKEMGLKLNEVKALPEQERKAAYDRVKAKGLVEQYKPSARRKVTRNGAKSSESMITGAVSSSSTHDTKDLSTPVLRAANHITRPKYPGTVYGTQNNEKAVKSVFRNLSRGPTLEDNKRRKKAKKAKTETGEYVLARKEERPKESKRIVEV